MSADASPAAAGRLGRAARGAAGRIAAASRAALPPALILLALIGIWELAARWDLLADALSIEPFLVPAPSDVAEALWNDRDLLADNAWVTVQEIVLGLALALAAGFAVALLLHRSNALRRALYPLLMASQTIPVIAIAPILVVWLGYGIGPKLVIIALVCFFPVTVNMLDGLRSVDPELPRMMRTLDASRTRLLWAVEVPSALPFLFSGAKIAAVVAVIGAVFGEWAGAKSGLGHLILVAQGQLQTARVFAAVTVLALIAIALFAAVSLLERRVGWWLSRPRPAAAGLPQTALTS